MDGPKDQVYTCARQPSEEHVQAVSDTEGIVLRYKGSHVAGFYVAGSDPMPPSCEGRRKTSSKTERFVTYNHGKTGKRVKQSRIGLVERKNLANRGCMSQKGANCLADLGRSTTEILNAYYGDDIELHQAKGACIESSADCKAEAVATHAILETNSRSHDSSVL